MEKKVEMTFNKAVYKYDGKIKVCERIFLDYWASHLSFNGKAQGSRFSGATGATISLVSAEEKAERVRDYDVDELWRGAVEHNGFTGSLADFRDELEASGELEEMAVEIYHGDIINRSELEAIEGAEYEYQSAGRCFDFDEMLNLYKERPASFKIYDEELFKAILAVEHTNAESVKEIVSRSKIDRAHARDAKEKGRADNVIRHGEGLLKAMNKK